MWYDIFDGSDNLGFSGSLYYQLKAHQVHCVYPRGTDGSIANVCDITQCHGTTARNSYLDSMLQKHSNRVMLHLKAAARCYQSRRAISITGFPIRSTLAAYSLYIASLLPLGHGPVADSGLGGHLAP